MKRNVVALALCLWAVLLFRPAWAGESEKVQFRNAVEQAAPFLGEAYRLLAQEPGNEAELRATFDAMEELSHWLIRAAGYNPANEGDPVAIARWDGFTRQQQLFGEDGAFFHLDRAIGAARAASILDDSRARMWLQNAEQVMSAIDRTLPYEVPANAPLIGRPGIGHGDLNLTVKRENTSVGYDGRDLRGWWLNGYLEGDTRSAFRATQLGVVYMGKLRFVAYLIGAYDPPDATTLQRSCNVLEGYRILWMDVARAYHFAMDSSALSDGWRTGVDHASQSGFFLPACAGAVSASASEVVRMRAMGNGGLPESHR